MNGSFQHSKARPAIIWVIKLGMKIILMLSFGWTRYVRTDKVCALSMQARMAILFCHGVLIV